ncbi:MAG: FAD-binding protein [Coriobacteriales bacterium]|nr:FAD-binding protein [Coriobacteriales bacterium]
MNEDCPYDYGAYAGSLCSRMYPQPGAINSELVMHRKEEFYAEYIEPFIRYGCMLKADTLDELIEQMQAYDNGRLDSEIFKASIERYDELCALGHDDDFGKLPFRLQPVDAVPYYAIMLTGSAICNLDGLRINTNIEVIDVAGKPIPGL